MWLYAWRTAAQLAPLQRAPALGLLNSSLIRTGTSLQRTCLRQCSHQWQWQWHSAAVRAFATASASSKPAARLPPAKQHPSQSPSKSAAKPPAAKQPQQHASPKPPSPSPFSSEGAHGKGLPPPSPDAKEYPAQLLIYRAPTAITIPIASLKLTAILIFVFASLALAPPYYLSPLEPTWMAAVCVVGGAIPMSIMIGATPPLVAYVHLALPQWARMSRERLLKYAQNLPPSAVLDIATVRWIWPRVTRLSAHELYLKQTPVGSINLYRNVPAQASVSAKWYHWRPVKRFFVTGRGSKVAEKDVWPEVLSSVRRGWVVDPRAKRFMPKPVPK